VRIDSAEGVGTKVHLLLPRAEAAAAAEVEAARVATAEQAAAGGATILVIDDDPDVRGFLAETLEGLGHRVETCDGGEQGIAQASAGAPDLVLLDFAMPGMNGAEAARRIRADAPRVPIVFVTGYSESEQIEAALGPGVPVLRKPFAVDELAAIVADQLEASPSGRRQSG
jgi:CheY-like chemotaxis protein